MIKTVFAFVLFGVLFLTNHGVLGTRHRECPTGWKMWKDSCYYFSKNARPWHSAAAACKSMDKDAKLAEIETKEESDFLEKTVFENAYMDCYYDNIERLLDGDFLDDPHNLTNERCVHYCKQRGYTFAGTEYSRQCFCGDSLAKYSPSSKAECQLSCTGDGDERCGGHWRLSVYLTAGKPHWLGGKCVPVDKGWKWFTSQKFINGYTDWNQKIACNKESCLDLNLQDNGYKWSDENCLNSLHYVCETPVKEIEPEIPPVGKECPAGWKLWEDSCYYFSKTTQPWHTASTVCKSMDTNAKLAEVETREENTFLKKAAFENAYMDCYHDRTERLLDGDFLDDADSLTNEKCVIYCKERGFAYAGTQFSRQCFCGDSLGKYSPTDKAECSLGCTGDSEKTCGGHWRLSVYLTAGTSHWLGGKCLPVDQKWKWSSSEKYISGYTDWNQNRSCVKESCLDLNLQDNGEYKWTNENCLTRQHFICETPAKETKTEPVTTTETAFIEKDIEHSGCVSNCIGLLNGDYQSCGGCSHYITCVFGSVVHRPCPRDLVWDDFAKRCQYSSSTCFLPQ